MKRIVLFVEGEGEAVAAPRLVAKLLTDLHAWDDVILDDEPFRVGQINNLVKGNFREWKRKLGAAMKRRNVGGVLLLLDGDIKRVGSETFCPVTVAKSLAMVARDIGAGSEFSVATVFARQEFESWLIASYDSYSHQVFPDGRRFHSDKTAPEGNLEERRDAKGWLNAVIQNGYKPTRDQETLTQWSDLALIRKREMRSFLRMESAVTELVGAIRADEHVATP